MKKELNGSPDLNGEQPQVLARSSLFRFVPEAKRSRLHGLFSRANYEFGDLTPKQDEPADAFFVIVSGGAHVVRMSETGQELSLNFLGPGAEFGESALLTGGKRNATVRCSSSVDVLRLERDDFLKLAGEFPQFKHSLELTARWRALHSFLYEFSNFGRLPGPVLQALVEKLSPKDYTKGQIVLREGEPAGPMYIIQQGRVRVYSGT